MGLRVIVILIGLAAFAAGVVVVLDRLAVDQQRGEMDGQ